MGNDKKRIKDPDYTFFPNPIGKKKGITKSKELKKGVIKKKLKAN